MVRIILMLLLIASTALAELPADFDKQVDRAIAEASARADEKFNIEEYKESLRKILAEGRAEFEKQHAAEIKRLTTIKEAQQ